MVWDYLIVGAGLTGATCARLLAEKDKTCMVIDKRNHIGGNCYDYQDDYGILTHAYGPHQFHTDDLEVIEFLSRFTDWQHSEYKVMVEINGRRYHFPISLLTFEEIIGEHVDSQIMRTYIEMVKEKYDTPANSEEFVRSKVGMMLFKIFYEGYTQKMWGRPAKELDPAVCGRIPIYYDRDDRYFKENFQGVPKEGYTKLFRKMLDHPKISVLLSCNYRVDDFKFKHMIYTGMIDAYYDYAFGRLPYRSLDFRPQRAKSGLIQPVGQINYPELHILHTRTVEYKHITKQDIVPTRIIREIPEEYNGKNEPYYPIPAKDSHELYQKYLELSKQDTHVTFAGRLGSYQYLNMDRAIKEAFRIVNEISQLS